MKKFIILPALALLLTVGVFTIGQQSKAVHAQALTVTQKTIQTPEKQDTTVSGEKSDTKEAETDGPGGHQDPQGSNVDHQFNGAE